MTNRFGVVLHSESVRWAAAEGVSETVIAAVLLLHERTVDEIVAKLAPGELEQVIKLVGRCPSCYPPERWTPSSRSFELRVVSQLEYFHLAVTAP
jgi:hypothetical protein